MKTASQRLFHSTPTVLQEPTVLVMGSSGALGSVVAKHLGNNVGMRVIGADIIDKPGGGWHPDAFVTLPYDGELSDLTTRLTKGVGRVLGEDGEINCIVCASGGWEGDPKLPMPDASEEDIEAGAIHYSNTVENMIRMNLNPVVAAGYVADRYMSEEGLFVVMGAVAALNPTPGMLGYGLSKNAAHHFVHTLGAMSGKGIGNKSLRKEGRKARRHSQYLDTMTAIGILPSMIDTPANRKADPKGNYDLWTKPIDIAKGIEEYIEYPALRPHSGSLIKVSASKGDEGGAVFTLVRS